MKKGSAILVMVVATWLATWSQLRNQSTRYQSISMSSVTPGDGAVLNLSLSEPQLKTFLETTRTDANTYFDLKDDAGHGLDTIKVVRGGAGEPRYVAVSHHLTSVHDKFAVTLSSSDNMREWHYLTTLDGNYASQPALLRLPDGRFLLAFEANRTAQRPTLIFRLFHSFLDLKNNRIEREFEAPKISFANSEGTPNFRYVKIDPDKAIIDIEVGFHFFDTRVGTDVNAIGHLRNFSKWTWRENLELNSALRKEGAAGNLGGRAFIVANDEKLTLVEGQLRRNDWGAWRLFLFNENKGRLTQIQVSTHKGSTSFGNPSLSAVPGIDNKQLLVNTNFVFDGHGGDGGPQISTTPIGSIQDASRVYGAQAGLRPDKGFRDGDGFATDPTIKPGLFVYGPYERSLEERLWRVTWYLAIESLGATDEEVAVLEVYDSDTKKTVAKRSIRRRQFLRREPATPFDLEFSTVGRSGHALEFRVWHKALTRMKLDKAAVRVAEASAE